MVRDKLNGLLQMSLEMWQSRLLELGLYWKPGKIRHRVMSGKYATLTALYPATK